ncbi:MAG: transglycosylase domain-containing protein [Myxococcales bacterium]|nr:transglycosylase domain-containing protein [Myxococcales bacterium]MCB9532333.1 transglycosylase domain-containing protein [Myxococcales bacterium]MCB9534593.1 transglycosylase domain-containing protein [Myxococcales bacterium]
MARASVVRPRVSLALDALGSAAAPADGSGDADAGDADAGDADAGAPAAAAPSPADPAEEPGLWGDRRWWERIPQRIDVTDGEVTLSRTVDGQPRTLSASGLRLAYALRAIGLQADVELDATLRRGDEPAGTVDIDAVWRWADEALTLDATLTDLDVGAAALLTPGLAALEPAGRADLRVRVRETESHALEDFSGQVTVRDVSVAVPVLQAPLAVPSASFEWRASRDEGRDAALVFIEGNGRLGEAAFELRPTIHGFNYHRERFGDSVDVDFVVPDQDASVLLHSVPRSLLGAVADAELTGRWGLSIAFPITFGQVPEGGGRRPIEIGETTRYEVRDEGLRLVSLPEAVDVRRLSGAFSFVFSRPGGGPPRTLSVRPPRDAGQIEGVEYGEPARWARLGDMSYFFIAATLYQEDGRFFRNHGINWFQWRQVLAQAWQEGELGRGASTISMQLVKNLFLTHERTVERKLQELFLTYWMTRLIPKERILETYFNVIELGPGVNGIFEAAAYYFGKSPNELTLAESVWLSSIIPAPARRGRQRDAGVAAEWSQRLAGDIMRGMESRGWITASELSRGLAETVRFVTAGGAPPATTGGDDAAWEGDEREARDEARDDALRELGVVDVIDGGGAGDLDLTDLALVDPADLAAAGTDALAPTGPDRIAALIATSIPLRTGSE